MFSILLATYNGEKYISKSIESILDQTIKEWELLIGINGTTDKSKEIVQQYKDKRIKIFDYGNDKGKAKTLNKLIKESKYNWLAIQDDDDIWKKNKLQRQLNYTSSYDVIGTYIHYIDELDEVTFNLELKVEDKDIKALSFLGNNQVANTSAIFKKSIAIDIGGWREDIDGIEDFDFWLKLMKHGKLFYNVPEYLVYHRIHKQSNFNTKFHDLKNILY